MSISNGGMLGGYNPPSTNWRGGLINLNNLSIAKSNGRFRDEGHSYISNLPIHPAYPLSPWAGKSVASMGEGTPYSIFVKDDGTKIFLVGTTTDSVRQADLSTPYDITTIGVVTSAPLTTPISLTAPTGLSLSPDGTKLFVLNNSNDSIYSYTLSTPWDVTTLTYDSKLFSVATQEALPFGLYVKPEGDKFWIVGSSSDSVRQYAMSTAWDLSTAVFENISHSVSAQDSAPVSIVWSGDGFYFYVLGSTGDRVHIYEVPTAWTLTGASFVESTSILSDIAVTSNTAETLPTGFYYVPNTKHWYFTGTNSDTIYQMSNRSTTRLFAESYISLTRSLVVNANPGALQPNFSGNRLFYSRANFGVYEVFCPNSYSLEGAAQVKAYNALVATSSSQPQLPFRARISRDGRFMYVHEVTTDFITQYNLVRAWDPDSAIFLGTASFASATIRDFAFSYSGDTIYYLTGATSSPPLKRTLSTPWDITTVSAASTAFTALDTPLSSGYLLTGMHFHLDGSALYLTDTTRSAVYKFIFSDPWNTNSELTLTSFVDLTPFGLTAPSGITVNPEGTTMLITDDVADRIYEFAISTDTL